MEIGIDIRPLSDKQLTGVGIYILEALKALFSIDTNNQYKLFYNSFSGSSEHMAIFESYKNVQLKKYNFPSKIINSNFLLFDRPFLDKLMGGVDIIWFPNLNFWSVSKKCKSIITVHDLSFKKIPWAYSNKMRQWHSLVKPKEKFKQADKIIAVSKNTKNDLVDLYSIDQNKIQVIYPGVTGYGLRATGNIPLDLPEKYILYLGTLEPRKNVAGVIKAFENLNRPEYNLVIAGGKGWLYKDIYRLVKKSKLKNKIKFIDYAELGAKEQLYKNASLLVWPSFYEGFGFPPLEAMAQGCPVITSTNSSLPEVVGEAALLVDPYNINEISFAIDQVLSDSNLRQSMIGIGYERVKEFSWNKTADQILNLFKSI